MTTQDREKLEAFTLRQVRLEEAVTQLRKEFEQFESKAGSPQSITLPNVGMPPLPVLGESLAQKTALPPLPKISSMEEPPPALPVPPELTPQMEPIPLVPVETTEVHEEKQGNLEFQFGRWLARIGVVFALITLISFSTLAYKEFHHLMGPWSKLGALGLVSIGLVAAGLQLERKNSRLIVYGRTLAGGGLACLYYTLYGATYVPQLQVIESPLLGGLLLLTWSASVLYLAERKKSELLSVFAIALAYFSSAITPVGDFTMVANLILSLTAVIFLVRNAWTGLSYLCLVGTYVGLLRQFIVYNSTSDFWFELAHIVPFWPAAIYLVGAWVIYTAGVFLANTPNFAAGKRMAFLCLNNGAFIGLLTLDSTLSGFNHIGPILCLVGGIFILTSYLSKQIRSDASDIADAYLMQGLTLATGGLAISYSGVTRGLLITVESVFLVSAGAFSRSIIMRIGGGVCALLGAGFLAAEIIPGNHYPWFLTFSGTLAMLANAWLARREFWNQPREVASTRWVISSSIYVLIALVLFSTGIIANADLAWIAPNLAIAAVVLTASIYVLPLFELPFLAQGLLVLSQVISLAPSLGGPPASQGMNLGSYAQPLWSEWVVGAATLLLTAWWPRQKIVSAKNWLQPLLFIYAIALVLLGYNSTHPYMDAQNWMISASLLSLAFLVYGAWTRTWQIVVAGQIFIAAAVWTFFAPTDGNLTFPWTWWAAAVPPAVVFLTGWLIHQWLPRILKSEANLKTELRTVAYIYQGLALGLVLRWICGVIPTDDQALTFFLLSTCLLVWNVCRPNAFGIRAGLIVSLVGVANYLCNNLSFSWIDSAAFTLFLTQPAILKRWGRYIITEPESWAAILISTATGWWFISHSIDVSGSNNMTLGWALYALAVIVIGFASNERRQRWCGLIVLIAAFIRVGVYDFWGFSDLYKVLTFFVLTVICLGLSFLYYKFADRLKEWL